MDRRLLSPGMLATHLAVLALAVLFIRLGIWQLDRLEERRDDNAVAAARLGTAAVDVEEALSAGESPDELEYRRVRATGVFDTGNEVLIRSQVFQGTAGFHVVTPLVLRDGEAVMVNRGWAPAAGGETSPPGGVVTVEGWIATGQVRPAFGPQDADGRLDVMSRIDLDRIESQLPYPIASVFIVETGERDQPPVPLEPPDVGDGGPHLAYAIQWFAFAAIGLIGYAALLRKRFGRPQEPGVDIASPGTTS